MTRHSEITTRGDVRVETYLDGPAAAGRRQDVVVLPSYGRDGGEDFDAFAAAAAAAGYRVLRPQPRGTANSTGPMADVTMEDLADDVASVVAHLSQAPAAVLGHAFGNFVARAVAANHPEMVSGIVLAAASGHTVDPEVNSAPFRVGDPALPDSERLAALELAFFAPGHDASIWLSGWYPDTLAMQHEAADRVDVERY